MLLNDRQIMSRCYDGMISPFVPYKIKEIEGQKITSYGLGSYGYDIRLASEFVVPVTEQIVDLKHGFDTEWLTYEQDYFILYPGHMFLGKSVETFNMPKDVTGIAVGKSTWARLGIFTNITPLEAGWSGTLTIEVSNIGQIPVVIYAGWGIAQILFLQGDPTSQPYSGKYQGQEGTTRAKL